MLIVHRLSSGTYRYYVDAVGPDGGPEPVLGEPAGEWMGRAAATLGLVGRVDSAAIRRILPRGPGRVPGFDLTFAAPKSVSVLHGLGPPEVVGAVRSAHDAAVAAGIAYIERHAAAVRLARRLTDADGLVVAAFRHRVSRADDPHLHTHAIVANAAPSRGDWRAIHSPLLYAEQRGAGAVYQSVLRYRLSVGLGVTWTVPVAGRADVEQVPPEVRAMFSRRRAAVLAEAGGAVADRGWAERFTRPEREGLVDMAALRSGWAERCGWVPPSLGPGGEVDPPATEVHGAVPADDRWTRSALMVALADRLPGGAPAERLEALAEDVLSGEGVLSLGRPAGRHAAPRYTTVAATRRQALVTDLLGSQVVSDAPSDLDRLRRERAPGRVLVVAGDDVTAAVIADRAGVAAAAMPVAVRAIEDLGFRAGDLLVVSRPERRDSRAVELAVRHALARGLQVAIGMPPDGAPDMGLGPGPVATIDFSEGSLTAAATAGAAAEQAIADWAAARREGRDAVLVAERAEVAWLAPRARTLLRSLGLVGDVEVGGWARGDAVVFTAGRRTAGLDRYAQATVIGPAAAPGQVALRFADGRRIDAGATWLAGAQQGHVVPPVPQLLSGRDAVYVVGGRRFADRHVTGKDVHHYVTVDVGDVIGLRLPGTRRVSLEALDQRLARAEAAPGTGDQARAARDLRAASEWLAHAESELRRAHDRHDDGARRTWEAQRVAASRGARRGTEPRPRTSRRRPRA